jgi:hypothetical protein
VYAYRRLTRPGMSEEIRVFFIRKHISYVTTFIVIWTFYLASSYYQLYTYNKEYGAHEADPWIMEILSTISIVAAMMTGFIMAIIRAREPYF